MFTESVCTDCRGIGMAVISCPACGGGGHLATSLCEGCAGATFVTALCPGCGGGGRIYISPEN